MLLEGSYPSERHETAQYLIACSGSSRIRPKSSRRRLRQPTGEFSGLVARGSPSKLARLEGYGTLAGERIPWQGATSDKHRWS
jgi:hypothetical protein